MKLKVILLCACLLIIGCGGSSPRFSSAKKTEDKKEQKKKGSIRFSSKVIEEETREDDKKVNVQDVKQRFSSATPAATGVPVTRSDAVKTAPAETGSASPATLAPSTTPATAGNFENQKMMDNILAWMGTSYEYGGETRSGIDCSAFTREMFRESAGISLPRSTAGQVKVGAPVSLENLKFGDLIFFNTTGENPSHVGIYIGDDMFAHASVSFGVTLSSMYSSYYKKRFTEARRVIN